MRTRIISAFPGTGKTHFTKQYPDKCLDSDSSQFSWAIVEGTGEKMRHSRWPQNYMDHIRENIGKVPFIFVSTHKEVREALLNNCLHFYLVFPDYRQKADYLGRYASRGSNEAFQDLVASKWGDWIEELIACNSGCEQLILHQGEYIADAVKQILKYEGEA